MTSENETPPSRTAETRHWSGRHRVGRLLSRLVADETLRAFLVLFFILNVAFFPFLWGDKTLLTSARDVSSVMPAGAYGEEPRPALSRSPDPGAPGWCFEPSMQFHYDQLRSEKRLPTWNPYMGFGAPWAANMVSQIYFPPVWPLALFEPVDLIDWFYVFRLLIAGFFTYLLLRYFLGWLASVVGGVACMLSGYFILYLNIEHTSTETLLPLVFYAMERLIREGSVKARLLGVATVFLSIVAGMPESTFLILMYGYAYFFFRLVTDVSRRDRWRSRITDFVGVNILGFGVAAFLLVPFFEFVHHAVDNHTGRAVGLMSFSDFRFSLLYFLPTAAGVTPRTLIDQPADAFTMFLGYFGVAPSVLALIAGLSILGRRRSDHRVLLTYFFGLSTVLFLLKIFGHPVVNWIGSLPIFSLVYYHKYLNPLLGFSVAALCALGADRLFAGEVRLRQLTTALLLTLGLIGFLAFSLHGDMTPLAELNFIFYSNLAYGLLVLLLLLIAATGCTNRSIRRRSGSSSWALGVTAIVIVELTTNYIYPVYYKFSEIPSRDLDPYAGAPYVTFLQEQMDSQQRVFAREGFLHPNWASVYQLHDVRYLQAIMFGRLSGFVRNFFPDERIPPFFLYSGRNELHKFDTWAARRFLQLSSVRYLVGRSVYLDETSSIAREILEQNQPRIAEEVKWNGRPRMRLNSYVMDGEAKEVLEHLPGLPRARWQTRIPGTTPILSFSPAADPRFHRGRSDGLSFAIEIETEDGSREELYRRFVDPKRQIKDRSWHQEQLDLRRYAGRNVALLFTVDPGPAGNSDFDDAGWAELSWRRVDQEDQRSPFRLVYDEEAKIFEFDRALPRASIYYALELVASREEALETLLNPRLDVRRRVVVSVAGLSPPRLRTVAALAKRRDHLLAAPATITHDSSHRVVLRAELEQRGVVVLNDSNFPGWKVYVDGLEKPMLEVNHLFRGVVVPKGSHEVEFRYEPLSLRVGLAISGLAGLALVGWLTGDRLRNRLRLARRHSVPLEDTQSRSKTKSRLTPS